MLALVFLNIKLHNPYKTHISKTNNLHKKKTYKYIVNPYNIEKQKYKSPNMRIWHAPASDMHYVPYLTCMHMGILLPWRLLLSR